MELKIMSPQEGGFVKEIRWNHEELKAEIATKMQDYKTLVFTEENIADAKKDRAALRKLRDAFDTERKRIKKLCMEPYDKFEKQVKEVMVLIDEPIQLIDSQIKEVEEQRRVEKKGEILELYRENIGTLQGMLPFEKVFKPEYLNVSKSMKSIREEILNMIQSVNTDLDTIESLESKYELQIKDMYLKTFDLSMAMREKARLEDVEKRIAERKEKEEQLKREAQKKEAAVGIPLASVPEQKTIGQEKCGKEDVRGIPLEETYILDFRVTATREQLSLLKEFLRQNHITYGPIPKEGE